MTVVRGKKEMLGAGNDRRAVAYSFFCLRLRNPGRNSGTERAEATAIFRLRPHHRTLRTTHGKRTFTLTVAHGKKEMPVPVTIEER